MIASSMALLVACTLFANAALVFLLEPFVGKCLMPWYGGSPAVWNACMFFFQGVLLAGYLYAHGLQRLSLIAQLSLHGALLAAAWLTLPVSVVTAGVPGPAVHPSWSVVVDLSRSVGLVFFMLSATSPLLQSWFSRTASGGNPYGLFAASNLGSLVGLMAFPFGVEPSLTLAAQSQLLTVSVAAVMALVAASGLVCWLESRNRPAPRDVVDTNTLERGVGAATSRPGTWLLLSLCPCMLLMGVTTHLTSEIAPMPLLWIMPLVLYLGSFVIAFSRWGDVPAIRNGAVVVFIGCAVVVAARVFLQRHEAIDLVLHSLLLAAGATALHCQLAEARPATAALTWYYALISLGGLIGSGFCVLVAPVIFNWQAEYPLGIAMALLLVGRSPAAEPRGGLRRDRIESAARLAVVGIVLLGLTWNVYFSVRSAAVLLRKRTFFGDFQVGLGRTGQTLQLVHGRTTHGAQFISDDPRIRRPPLCYYFFTGPAGRLMLANRGAPAARDVAVVGLGVGSLAAYAERGDRYDFYEIDEAVRQVADDGGPFRFLSDARDRGATLRVIIGDARLRLADAAPSSYGMIILDAFSSDAIPVHLLTVEAVAEYLEALREDGVLVFHISNIFVDLEPVLANLATALDLEAYVMNDVDIPAEEAKRGRMPSTWVVAARAAEPLAKIIGSGGWQRCRPRAGLTLWTDQFSSVPAIMRQWGDGGRRDEPLR